MSFLHVLLAIAFTLALVWARTVLALEHRWTCRMLVIDVTITLFLGRPAILMILATGLATLPRSGMRFFMLARNSVSNRYVPTGRVAYVKSHGRLKVFSQSRQRCESWLGGGTPFRRRPIERNTSSSDSSLAGLLYPLGDIVVSLSALTVEPVLRETDLPFLILTSSTGLPLRLKPPWRPSRSPLTRSAYLKDNGCSS